MGGGGGGEDCYLQGFGGSFRGGLAVGSLACNCWTLSERERRRPSRIACEISLENDFTSSSSKSDSLVHVRDCTPSWVKELPGGVADDVIFPIRVVGLRVGPSEMGLLPVQVVMVFQIRKNRGKIITKLWKIITKSLAKN